MAHLAKVREDGFDVCDSELDDNVWAVSAPVFDALGSVEYGVTVAAASARMPKGKSRNEAIDLIVKTAAELSAGLGYRERDASDLPVRAPSSRETARTRSSSEDVRP